MSSFARIVMEVAESANTLSDKLNLNSKDPAKSLQNVAKLFEGIAGFASYGANVKIAMNAVRATGTITFTGAPTEDDTITINGVAFTAKDENPSANEFEIGDNVTETAENLVAAVNASTTAKIKNLVKASNAAGVVTIAAVIPGTVGNLFTLAESMDNTTVSGANLTGGTEDTDVELAAGIAAETSA